MPGGNFFCELPRNLIYLPGFVLLILPFACVSQPTANINYTIQDGLPSNTIYAIEQDDRGFIWIGTDAGLSRYDGYEFRNFSLDDGLPDIELLNFYKDSSGKIWFYTLNGKVGYVLNDTIYSSKNTPVLKALDLDSRITSIQEFDQKIYISALHHGMKILDKDMNVTEQSAPLTPTAYGHTCFCENNLYWLTSSLNVDENKRYHLTKMDPLEGNKVIDQVTLPGFFKNGIGYFLCVNGFLFNYGTDIHSTYLKILRLDNFEYRKSVPIGSNDLILNIKRDEKDRVLAFSTSGVYRYDPANDHFHQLRAIRNSTSRLLDQEGNIWITSLSDGVFFYPKTPISNFDPQLLNISKFAQNEDYLFFIHNNKYLASLDKHLRYNRLLTLPNDVQPQHLGVLGDSIIISTYDGIYFTNLEHREIDHRLPFSTRSSHIRDSIITIATIDNLVHRLNRFKGEMTSFSSGVRINHLIEIGQDSTILATDKGLLILNEDTIRSFTGDAMPQVRINRLAYHKGQLWCSTSGNGLISIFPKTGEITPLLHVDPSQFPIIQEMQFNENYAWMSTKYGLSKIEIEGDTSSIKRINPSNGLNPSVIYDLTEFNDMIFLAQQDGLFYFPENTNFEETSDFFLYLDKINTKKGAFQQNDFTVFPHDIGNISFTFKALIFQHRSSLTYQYRLIKTGENIPEWTSTTSNLINYSDLSFGDFQFQFRARTKNSTWTGPKSFTFQIQPAFWDTYWFRSLVLLALISLTILIYKEINSSAQMKRKLENERVVAEIKALKAQINPHFLFNALNSIQSFLLSNENELAEEYLIKYSKLMRRILDQSSLLTIPLSEEIQTLQLYVDLETYRARNSFRFRVRIDEQVDPDEKIPSMILQPFIENAIWHGVSNLPDGLIQLKVKKPTSKTILLEVSDNGRGFDPEEVKSSSQGSRLAQDRLDLLNEMEGIKSKVELKTEINKGTNVTIWVTGELY